MTDQKHWYAGVDWASESHHVFLTDGDGRKIGERVFRHGGEGLAEMAGWLMATSGAVEGPQIQVAIEVPHGPVVETLIERGFKVHAINPKQMDRFRDRFTLAGAKDDSRDAEVMASALRTDRRCFRLLAAADPVVIELREWSRIAEDLGAERNRLTNRLREQLWRYFPAMLELENDLGAEWLLDLWETVPTPAKAARIRGAAIARLLKRHRIRRFDAVHVLDILRKPPVKVAAGATEAASAHIATLIARVRLVNRQLRQAHHQLDTLTARLVATDEAEPGHRKQHDVEILASLPGVGRIVLATLLAEALDALQRRDYAALRSLTGVAPVTKRSGKSCLVVRRQACHDRLANAMYHWARVAIQHDPRSRSKYVALRSRGHSHGRALRSVADRLLNVACAMLKTGTTFDPSLAAQKSTC
ncbi:MULTISPECIES: IS110 family transposase [unclassified Bradyrhizobium]|uniref:IS110 family transposase n=1 Tax=unclassified Bradyrhizobium TaxID=2631580 RepID=UPI0024789D69|nr:MULTISPECIES: IS110 family transposase [unclassified Bradyrhizobium]WGS19251.1 IS110 family transposase [Bradyrhizobium sp. ISRA463]WGS26087.1 IS110 family transposase [Bradyrhizobium sp. ISRA464]